MNMYGFFNVGEHSYRCSRINAVDQFHMMRRLAPIMSSVTNLSPSEVMSGDAGREELLDTISSEDFLKAIAGIENKDYDFIFSKCLGSVSRQVVEGSYSPILSQNGGFMYEDLKYDLHALGLIIFNVLKFNFSDFFKGLLQNSQKPAQNSTEPN